MKEFSINCDFGGQMSPFTIFIGKPQQGHHPLHFQAAWLQKERGGMIPEDVMTAVQELQELAEKNGVALEELCVYALSPPDQQTEAADVEEEADAGNTEIEEEDQPVDEEETATSEEKVVPEENSDTLEEKQN